MLEINKRYQRISPTGDETIVSIKTEKELQYQESFLADKFIFNEIVPSVAPAGVCISCEG